MSPDKHPGALLPWYVNRTLEGSELEEVERHLETCGSCRNEVGLLEKMRMHVKGHDIRPPTDLGLRRLMREVKSQRAKGVPRWWRGAAAAAIAVVLVQTALLANTFLNQPEGIVPLGEAAKEGIVLQVRFASDTPEARIRAVLQEVGAVFVDGPSVSGLYQVRLTKGLASPEEAVRQGIAQFRASGIVEHVAQE